MTHINEIATMPPSPVKTAFMAIARYYYLEFIAGTRFADRPVAEYVDYGHGDMQVFEAFGNKKSFASP
ncbi:MAG TPA: hypothetical protein PK765_00625 [bacterium]|nr:hypothetical protein [bacterium]